MKNKSQIILELFVDFNESKDIIKSRKMKLAWKKYRNNFQFGMNRKSRLSRLMSSEKSEFVQRLKRSLESYKNKKKSEKLSKQKQLEKTQLNLIDSKS